MEPPLTLIFNQISPPSLIPSYIPSPNPISSNEAKALPTPPSEFQFSPTPNYPLPFGSVSLGSNLNLDLSLENTDISQNDILGVKMMIESQGPGGRFRLGEVIHETKPPSSVEREDGEGNISEGKENPSAVEQKEDIQNDGGVGGEENKLPILKFGEKVNIKLENEIKDLGLNVLIISVAWETLEGRKTFQRFLKFNVNPPLSIKTRIQTPTNPNTLLSKTKREQIYLEILIQNVWIESMILFKSKIFLEPVKGLSVSVSLNSTNQEHEDDDKIVLLPEDIRQFLFILSPSDSDINDSTEDHNLQKSIFPPVYTPGTILPLGRLDVSWLSGPYHLSGRLQTSTLNRRVPILPNPQQKGGLQPTRSLSSQSNQNVPGSPLVNQNKDRLNNNTLLAPSPMKGNLSNTTSKEGEDDDQWEFDLTLIENKDSGDDEDDEREFEVDKQFSMNFRLGIRFTQYIGSSSARKASTFERYSVDGENDNNDDVDDDKPLSRISSKVENELPPPPIPKLAIQYLTHLPNIPINTNAPQLSILPPSRTSTPVSPSITSTLVDRSRPFSPLTNSSSPRPITPSSITNQLRQAQSQGLNSTQNSPRINRFKHISITSNNEQIITEEDENQEVFPPSPYITSVKSNSGQFINIGNSITILPNLEKLEKVVENTGPMYDDEIDGKKGKSRWEAEVGFKLDFISFEQGLFGLGGLRILLLDDKDGEIEGNDVNVIGKVGKEWLSLGDISIV